MIDDTIFNNLERIFKIENIDIEKERFDILVYVITDRIDSNNYKSEDISKYFEDDDFNLEWIKDIYSVSDNDNWITSIKNPLFIALYITYKNIKNKSIINLLKFHFSDRFSDIYRQIVYILILIKDDTLMYKYLKIITIGMLEGADFNYYNSVGNHIRRLYNKKKIDINTKNKLLSHIYEMELYIEKYYYHNYSEIKVWNKRKHPQKAYRCDSESSDDSSDESD